MNTESQEGNQVPVPTYEQTSPQSNIELENGDFESQRLVNGSQPVQVSSSQVANIDQPPLQRRNTYQRQRLMQEEESEHLQKFRKDNKSELIWLGIQLIYFTICACAPAWWSVSQKATYDQCGIAVDTVSIVYICLTLVPLFLVRIYQQLVTFNSNAGGSASRAQEAAIVDFIIKMVVQFSFFLYANIQWRDCTSECWDNASILMINFILTIALTAGSGISFGCFLSCVCCCLPCIIAGFLDSRKRGEMKDQVIKGLTKMKYNPDQFKHQKDCVICLEEFKIDDEVTPLSCDARHYFHTECITGWMKHKTQCPLCKKDISEEDLRQFKDDVNERLLNDQNADNNDNV